MINFCWMRKLFIFQKRRGVRCGFWVDRIYTQLNKMIILEDSESLQRNEP